MDTALRTSVVGEPAAAGALRSGARRSPRSHLDTALGSMDTALGRALPATVAFLVTTVLLAAGLLPVADGELVTGGSFRAGTGPVHHQFQFEVDVPATDFPQEAADLHVLRAPSRDGYSFRDEVIVPIILGSRIVPRFVGYGPYVVRSGDTLADIAAAQLGAASQYPLLLAANMHSIPDPEALRVGQHIRIPLSW